MSANRTVPEMPRPPVKKTYKLAKAKRKGELQAEVEQEYKGIKWIADLIPFLPTKYKKNAALGIEHFLSHHGEKIPKLAALLGCTYLIKVTVDWTQGVFARALERAASMPFPLGIGILKEGELPAARIKIGEDTETIEWIFSFVCAYIIIEHGGQLIGLLGDHIGSLTGIVGFLLG